MQHGAGLCSRQLTRDPSTEARLSREALLSPRAGVGRAPSLPESSELAKGVTAAAGRGGSAHLPSPAGRRHLHGEASPRCGPSLRLLPVLSSHSAPALSRRAGSSRGQGASRLGLSALGDQQVGIPVIC